MIIKPKYKGFICLTAHPEGCYKNVEDFAKLATSKPLDEDNAPKNVLVLGGSTGYGLASRITATFAAKANTMSVAFERPSTGKRTATTGYYNDAAVTKLAKLHGLNDVSLNGDAFSDEMKAEVIKAWNKAYPGEKIDLVVYSLASPKRKDPKDGELYSSVIKPVGEAYTNKTVDFHSGVVTDVTIEPAAGEEVDATIKVMGGEDWKLWIDALLGADLLSDDVITVAYSYIGPEITHAIYKDGTIGLAKNHLLATSELLNDELSKKGGRAFVSVNKALVTQSSAAIPVVPLYISLLYKVMKEDGSHEDTLDQMLRLFHDKLYSDINDVRDLNNPIRIDDLEMEDEIQAKVDALWKTANSDNIEEISDLVGYRKEFFSLFGFGRDDVDYELDVEEF
ncbi:MAG: trans-2-enoyl-CoA reductase family protein [Clostridiales Family XIII bacterium]|jgi:enoyl-[acyl-carrier protein] reductase/trans-2-enoyl-CoA reductase (NAD+)|nr:trans-2-enoyl-CoA reductase family protein [Clostridiales Family XIII bacterium]